MKEYLFFSKDPLEFPLDESIFITDTLSENESQEFLVANTPATISHIHAPEINYYLQQTQDTIADQISRVKYLYDIRATIFDGAQHFDYTQPVGQRLLVISSDNKRDIAESFVSEGFAAIWLDPDLVIDLTGNIGDLAATIRTEDGTDILVTDQILWYDAPAFAMRQSGVYDPEVSSQTEAFNAVRSHQGVYHYKNFLSYDSTICQYHERLTDVCGKCEEVCPTTAILKIETDRHLAFDPVNCHGCGGCVSVCPSGALDYTQMPIETFDEVAEFYHDLTPLILPEQIDVNALDVPLAPNVLPLMIPGQKFLNEVHLLSMLQRSGQPVIFYADVLAKGTGDAITMLNEIFERRYHKQAIFYCQSPEELQAAMGQMEPIPECRFGIETGGMKKREVFTHRLSHLVGEKDLGVITTGDHIHYGAVTVNPDACTLCLACVGACNAGALTAHPEDNSLRFNGSMCTDCGYCEHICPEKECITVHHDELHLKPDYFKQIVLAHDELFKCVECGKEFATVKSVEKIAAIMAPRFGDDEARIRSLYCCPDCKPKVMFKEHLATKHSGVNHG